MRAEIICPKTGFFCDREACQISNEPLEAVVPGIVRKFVNTPPRWETVKRALSDEIEDEARKFGADFAPTFDNEGSCTICPIEVTEGLLGKKFGSDMAATGIVVRLHESIEKTEFDIRAEAERRK